MRITVDYNPDTDLLCGELDTALNAGSDRTGSVEWNEDLEFHFKNGLLMGFSVENFRYFVDFVPFEKLFGDNFVEWLSAFQSRWAAKRASDEAYERDLDEKGRRSAERFSRELVRS